MRDPIPSNRELLLVLIKSQFMLLSDFVKDPKAYTKSINSKGPAKLGNLNDLSIPELRALALDNAEKIFELLLLSGRLPPGVS